MKRLEMLDALDVEWSNCKRCTLETGRRRVVTWRGDPKSDLMVVIEAPSEADDAAGSPMVGDYKAWIESCFRMAGADPARASYVTALGCRSPFHVSLAQLSSARRACAPRLATLFSTLSPRAVVQIGRFSLDAPPHVYVFSAEAEAGSVTRAIHAAVEAIRRAQP